MPIYEYECAKCGERFELRRSLADKDSEIQCPGCGEKNPERVFSLFCTVGSSTGGSSGCAPAAST
ncbi:MAG: zinc ribbon domain-containing protein [Dehalococcoidia bacterium]|nr:zinc ribbon domain-containing protein [Dehalococcoidia bacterium]